MINSLSRWWRTDYTAECRGNLPQGRQDILPEQPTRTSWMQLGPTVTLRPLEDLTRLGLSGVGVWYEAEKAQTKDGAGGGPEDCQ